MGVVIDSPVVCRGVPRGQDPAKAVAKTPKRRPSLREDSSPVKPLKAKPRSPLPLRFATFAQRFADLLGEPEETSGKEHEAPHIACFALLLACHYDEGDVLTAIAMASANVLRQEAEFKQMGDRERAFLAAIHLYLAHVFVFDECVPLRFWHEWAFSKYCTFGCLNRTVGKLLRLMHYRPTVDHDIVLHNVAYLKDEEEYAVAAPLKGKW